MLRDVLNFFRSESKEAKSDAEQVMNSNYIKYPMLIFDNKDWVTNDNF